MGITTFELPTHHHAIRAIRALNWQTRRTRQALRASEGSASAGTVARKRGHAVLRAHERERDRLVVQLDTSVGGAGTAYRAVNLVLEHGGCAEIDINMGSPKQMFRHPGGGVWGRRSCATAGDGAVDRGLTIVMRAIRAGRP